MGFFKNLPDSFHAFKHQLDWKLLEKLAPFAEGLKQYHHYKVYNIHHIPENGRAMILVNHSVATYDILLLGYEIIDKLGRLPRGLADRNFYKNPHITEVMEKLGIYEANPTNAQKVLEDNELLMLAPGGTQEAIRSSNEKYQIKWDNRTGFAKLAIRTQTPIILAACPSADNLYTVKSSPITKWAYKLFRFPLPFVQGIGSTILPRPIQLTHYIHAPIYPPKFEGGELSEEMVKDFHNLVVKAMNELMEQSMQTLKDEPK